MATRSTLSDHSDAYLKFIPDKCPRCFVLFDYIKRTGNNVSKLPLILPCNHIICEDCLYKLAVKENCKCPICQSVVEVPKSHLNRLCELFTPHYTLIGYLLFTKNTHTSCKFDMISSGRTIRDRQSGISTISNHSEELSEPEFEDIDADKNYLKFKKCKEHIGKDNDIFCKTCNQTICSYCFVENHIDHAPSHLYKLTDDENAVLKESIVYLKSVLNTLHQSLKKLNQIQTVDCTDIRKEIKKFFTNYHGKLHLIEKNLYDQLNNLNNIESSNNEENKFEIQQTINRINRILTAYKTLKTTKSINVKALFSEVENFKNVPCKLVAQNGENSDFVQFVVDDKYLDDLETKFEILQTNNINYQLVPYDCNDKLSTISSTSEIVFNSSEENYMKLSEEKAEEEDEEGPDDEESCHYRLIQNNLIDVDEDNSSENSTDEMPIQQVKHESKTKDKLREVLVTHLNDLDSFYVQQVHSLIFLKEMHMHLRKYSKRNVKPEKLKLNHLYLVCYITKGHNYYRRGRLIRIIDNTNNDNNSSGDIEEKLYEIFYIDYGNTQIVTRDKLYLLHQRGNHPPMAFHCKLKNSNNTEWNPDARINFIQIVKGKELLLKRYKQPKQTPEEVELFVRDSNNSLIKIVDLLQQINDNKPSLDDKKILKNTVKLFKNTTVFEEGQKEFVNVITIKDPYKIYVQLARNEKYLEELRRNMSKYFIKNQRNSCIPAENSDVIVKYNYLDCGDWYRAHIQSICVTEKTAQVFLVDYGDIVTISWSDIRQLPEEFCRFEAQAIRVRLADVKSNDNGWSEEVRNLLAGQLLDTKIQMVVSCVKPLEVGFFKIVENGDICINALLVEEKFAQSTGILSENVFWPANSTENKFDETLILSKTLQATEDVLSKEDDFEVIKDFKQSITVVRYENPYLIYIKFQSNNDKEELMHKELQIHYNLVRTKKNLWKPNELCVIWDEMSSCYRRGIIRRKMPNFTRYVVYLYDELRDIELDISSIFVYDKYFQNNYFDFIYKCYLANIRPAGDGKQWTQTSIESLEQIFRNRKDFYIKKVENRAKLRKFGVIMWYVLTISGTALQPIKQRFVSINDLLIQSGLALNNRKIVCIESQTENIINKLDEDDKNKMKEPTIIEQCFTKTWPNFMPVKVKEFNAKIICIDTNGTFYIRDSSFDELYRELELKMKEQFDNNDNIIQRNDWKFGEMCTIKYENYWYRGTVLDVINSKQIKVEMIDFASEHDVNIDDLCAEIMFPDIAPLLYRVRLFNIFPANGDYWPTSVYEKIYQIVETDIRVIIKSNLTQPIPLVEIYTRNGRNLNQIIVDNCDELIGYNKSVKIDNFSNFTDDTVDDDDDQEQSSNDKKDNLNWTEDDDFVADKFYYPPLPIGQMSDMFLINVLKFNEIVLTYNAKQLNEELDLLTENIEKSIDEQPALDNPNINQPCVGFIKKEKKWGRAKILNLNSYGFATVFFVDYAVIEMIVISDLKQIKPEWLELLVHNYIAIINIKLTDTNEENRYLNKLKKSIGHSIVTEIINDDPLTVQLYFKEKH